MFVAGPTAVDAAASEEEEAAVSEAEYVSGAALTVADRSGLESTCKEDNHIGRDPFLVRNRVHRDSLVLL